MTKSRFFSAAFAAFFLTMMVYFSACVKEQSVTDTIDQVTTEQVDYSANNTDLAIVPLVEGGVIERGCSPAAGRLGVSTSTSGGTSVFFRIETRGCPNSAWGTIFTGSGSASLIIPFMVNHDTYYRITVTNNSNTARNFT
jgi:hypothetical protein